MCSYFAVISALPTQMNATPTEVFDGLIRILLLGHNSGAAPGCGSINYVYLLLVQGSYGSLKSMKVQDFLVVKIMYF